MTEPESGDQLRSRDRRAIAVVGGLVGLLSGVAQFLSAYVHNGVQLLATSGVVVAAGLAMTLLAAKTARERRSETLRTTARRPMESQEPHPPPTDRRIPVNVSPTTQPPAATQVAAQTHTAVKVRRHANPQVASAAVRQRANSDGDGRTGAAALNDGDAAARTAAQQVKSVAQSLDVKV